LEVSIASQFTVLKFAMVYDRPEVIDLPDNLSLTEADLRIELAIALFQRNTLLIEQAAQLTGVYVEDFY
jgi:predicted HTH domain antitoxin